MSAIPATAGATGATSASGLQPGGVAERDAAIESRVDDAQAELVLVRHRASNLIGIAMAGLIGWVLWDDVDQRLVLGWVAAKTLVGIWRIVLTRRFDADPLRRAAYWARRFDVALAADGLVFGLLGTLLLPAHNAVLAAIMIATLLGIAAVGLVVLAVRMRSMLALMLPTLVPAMLLQLAQGDKLAIYIALGIGTFLALAVLEGGKSAAHARDMLRLRFRMDELAAQRAAALDLAQRNAEVKDRFLATMSHEMRTPLNGILGLVRMLQHRPADAAMPHETLRMLERTGEHLLGVINDVLDFSKMQAGHLSLARQSFDLAALIDSVVEVSRVQAADKGLRVDSAIAVERPCWVAGDPTRLRQILLNLTCNAVKFTAEGSVGVVLEREAAGVWRIDVVDTGPGVPADARESIFHAFTQADGSQRRRYGGTGLGLTISRELAQMMGGTLCCLATDGAGATFRLRLPLPAAEAVAPVARSSAELPMLSGRVLLVEDNPINLKTAVTRAPVAPAAGSAGLSDRRCAGRCMPAAPASDRGWATAPQLP